MKREIQIVTTVDQLPPGRHHLILTPDCHLVDDGYGGHSRQEFMQVTRLPDESAWRSEIVSMKSMNPRPRFVPMIVDVPHVTLSVSVDVSI